MDVIQMAAGDQPIFPARRGPGWVLAPKTRACVYPTLALGARIGSSDRRNGQRRANWAQTLLVNTRTVAPNVITALAHAYGDRFLDAPPSTSARVRRYSSSHPASWRAALLALWKSFAGALDLGEQPQTAASKEPSHNHMLRVQLAGIAESIVGAAIALAPQASAEGQDDNFLALL